MHQNIFYRENKNIELLKSNTDLTEKLNSQKANQVDIYHYLHKKLDDNYDVISKLEAELLELRNKLGKKEKDFGK